ncbi:hypothetical protein ABBQ32_002849 [Trebouxia sp. C0010 RCD-2024]
MLSASFAQTAVHPCASYATAQHRHQISIRSVRICSCCTNLERLRPPTSTQFKRRKLRRLHGRRHPTACASVQVERPGTPVDRRGFEWATNVSRHGNVYFAVDETSQACLASMGDSAAEPTVALIFASSSYSVEFDRIIPVLRSKVPSLQHIIGCTGFGVIGGSAEGPQEVEGGEAALSLTLGVLPGVQVAAHHISNEAVPDADSRQEAWQELMQAPIDLPPNHSTSFVVIADPTFHRITDLMAGLDYAYPEAAKIGGFVSSATQTARRALFCWSAGASQSEDGIVKGGAAVLSLQGPLKIEPIVAQGCRPLTQDSIWLVEKSENNIIMQVRGVDQPSWRSIPPLAALQLDLNNLKDTDDRQDVSNNLTLAVAPDDFKDESQLDANDFLIRGIIGMDPKVGAIAVGETVGVGKRIRFMVRDKEGAKQDLQNHAFAYKRRELQASMEGKSPGQAFGALIFSCNGRGRNLFGEPHYDSRKIAEFIPVPSSGFLCNGEIGQIANSTALHGFTCAVGVLRLSPADDD